MTSLRTDITAGDSGAIADINTAWGAVNALTRDTGDIVYNSGNMLNGWAGYVAPSFSLALRRIGSTVTLGGYVNGSAATDIDLIALPVGYRPTRLKTGSMCDTSAVPQRVLWVDIDGSVRITSPAYTHAAIIPMMVWQTADAWPA